MAKKCVEAGGGGGFIFPFFAPQAAFANEWEQWLRKMETAAGSAEGDGSGGYYPLELLEFKFQNK